MGQFQFKSDCVGTEARDVPALRTMIDGERQITRRTFLRHIDRAELAVLEQQLGYEKHPAQGLTMAADWHVGYYRSTWKGRRCYFFRWSAIEYYFTEEGR